MVNLAAPPVPPPPLATLADVELCYGPVADEDRAKVTRMIAWASAAVRRYCRRTLTLVAEDTVVVPSTGTTLLELAELPVVEVHEVVVGPDWWIDDSGGWAAPSDRYTWDAAGRLRRLDGLPWGALYDPVAVTYTHGYATLPDDLVGLVAAKVAGALAGQGANPGGLKSLQVGAMSETYANALGTDLALGPAVLSQAEQAALVAGGYRRRAVTVGIGAQ